MAFELSVDASVLKVVSVRAGGLIDDGDLLELVLVDGEAGTGAAAFSRKDLERATSGSGALAVVTLEVVGPMAGPSVVAVSDVNYNTAGGVVEGVVRLASDAPLVEIAGVPSSFVLHGAYPNPFNPATTVAFDLPASSQVTLFVYDLLGREVSRVLVGERAAGNQQTVRFDAQGLPSGTYLYRLQAQTVTDRLIQTGQFTLLK